MKKVILYLAANPFDTTPLQGLQREIQEVKREIRNSKYGKRFDFQAVFAASPEDIRTEMVELHPQIVHFSGHGAGSEGIILDDGTGNSHFVTGDALEDFFKQFDCVECIVLNACYSNVQAEALAKLVKYVIGIHNQIDDHSARKFSTSFYNALGNGYSVESAFEVSRSYLNLKNKSVVFRPVLLKRKDAPFYNDNNSSGFSGSIFEPLKEFIKPFLSFAINPVARFSNISPHARNEIQSLILQWIAVSTVALVLAAGVSTGPTNSLFNTFRVVALLSMPLLQWNVIKYWMKRVPWWAWFIGTAIGWIIGWLVSWLVGQAVTQTINDSPVYYIDLTCSRDSWSFLSIFSTPQSFSATCDLYGDSDGSVILKVMQVVLGLVVTGGVIGLIQGFLLNWSFLRINPVKWTIASIFGMIIGSLLGVPFVLFYSLVINSSPDDFIFALLLGLTYGVITGRVLLPHIDKTQSSSSATKVPVFEAIYQAIIKFLRPQEQVSESANWALGAAIVSLVLFFSGLIPAVVAILLGHRALREIAASEGHLGGKRRAIVALSIGYIIAAIRILILLGIIN